MYHLPQPVNHMDELFYSTHNYVNTIDIIKQWVMELSNFRSTPNHVYKTKSLRKAYQFLIVFACRLYIQESTKTFPRNWVVLLDYLVNDGKPFNWSYLLAYQLKFHATNAQNLPKNEQARFYMSAYLLYAICA